jgi:DNA segregation ATPase FtsK/SpoIIIE, S-DNA-T family
MPVGILSRRNSKTKNPAHHSLAKQVIGVLWFALYIVATLSLFSYDPGDLSFNVNPPNTVPTNFIGYVGAGLAWFLYVGFGFGAYLICALFLVGSLVNFLGTTIRWRWKPLWIVLLLVSCCCLLDLQHIGGWLWIQQRANVDSPGGLVGGEIVQMLVPYALGSVGASVLFGTIAIVSAIYLFNFNPILTALGAFSFYRRWIEEREERRLAEAPPQERLARESQRIRRKMDELHRQAALDPLSVPASAPASEPATIRRPDDELLIEPEPEPEAVEDEPEEEPARKIKPAKITRPPSVPAALEPAPATSHDDYKLPGMNLLTLPSSKAREAGLSDAQLRKNLELIIETLRVFGVTATAGEITPGATITRYEVYPGSGVRVDKIKALGKDLSRVLCAERINILAPIPGRDSVGIEIPNSNKVSVFLRELLESRDWAGTAARIPIALGKDVYGKTLVADLAAMPHMLIGGTTGSGKSVCINCILMSFLYRFSPDDLRLILIDPKQVEMQVYNSIPHLVVPVVTDPKKVMLALRWVINEMETRYRILAKVGVRNIASFNSRPPTTVAPSPQLELNVPDVGEEDEDGPDETPDAPIRVPRDTDLVIPAKLPYIVVIIDELADLMQTAPADVESAVARLTAKARAAGIHLIVATQTPRREVVTGVIKTNIPARMAFQVPSGLDSRVILDENGAENLLGRGDLLYRPPGVGRLTRGQGAFVSDEEVQDVVKFCAAQGEAQFVAEIHNKLSGKAPADMEISEADRELIIEAFEVIRQEKRASTSNLQRRMRLGYNRAAYVIDYLEKIGVLAPGEGAKPREILVDLETYNLEF